MEVACEIRGIMGFLGCNDGSNWIIENTSLGRSCSVLCLLRNIADGSVSNRSASLIAFSQLAPSQ